MNILDTRHFKNYKFLLTIIGQYPHQSRIQQKVIRCIVSILILSIYTPKLIKLFESFGNIDIIFECIPMIGLHTGAIIKYVDWTFHFEKAKQLYLHLEEDGRNIKTDHEIEIMNKHIKRAKLVTTAYATAMFSILGLYLVSPAVPKILDLLMPRNTSRNNIYLYQTEYFVDPDEYYVPILLHAYMTVPFSLAVIVFFDNLLGTYVHHASAMFTILKSYLENLHVGATRDHTQLNETNPTYKKIIHCVNLHKRTLKFSKTVEAWCTNAYLFLLLLNLFMITLTGIVTVMKRDEINEALKFFAFTVGTIFHLFYTSYIGQELIDHSHAIFNAAYSSQWYKLPRNLQELLIPVMMRSITPCKITAGSISDISMDTFSLVIKNSMSFFTVLSSYQ